MKKFLSVLLLLALFCGVGVSALAANEPVRIAWWGSEVSNAFQLELCDMFTKATGIEYEAEYLSWSDYWVKMNTLAAASDLPDVIRQDYSRIQGYVEKGLLMDLNELVEANKIDLNKVSDSALSGGVFDGKLYGINIGSNAFCFIQNEKLLKDAGMALLPRDATWEDFEKFCLDYTEKTGKIAVSLPGFDLNVFRIRARSQSQDLYNDDQKALGFDKQLLVDHLAMMKRLHDAGATDNISVLTTNISNEDRSFAKGEAAMIFDWTDTYTTYDNLLKADFGGLNLNILPGSAEGKGMYIKPSQLFSVPVTSENVDAAATFINYWVNDMDANMFLAGRRGVPINNDAADKVAENLDDTTQRVFAYISTVLPEYSSKIFAPDPAANSEVADEYTKQIQLVLFGQSTPEQAVDNLFAFAEKALNQ
ncbi:MAG: ABC transporter substrate-binding protein [Christensenellales bacterium]|jgi:multiple sugar transport system substrate-binding protein